MGQGSEVFQRDFLIYTLNQKIPVSLLFCSELMLQMIPVGGKALRMDNCTWKNAYVYGTTSNVHPFLRVVGAEYIHQGKDLSLLRSVG